MALSIKEWLVQRRGNGDYHKTGTGFGGIMCNNLPGVQ